MAQHALERLMRKIEGQEWLDRPGHTLEHGYAFVQNVFGLSQRPVRRFLHGVWFGHPLHPALTDVPIGSWTTALVLDTMGAGKGRREREGYQRAARRAVGLGVVGALGAAVTGLTDWQYTHDYARRLGLVHGALNAVALGLYTWSWWERRRERHGRGRLAAMLGYPLVAVSGYLGGGLTFRHLVGADQSEQEADRLLQPRDFTPVLRANELQEGTPRRVEACGVGVLLVRSNGQIHALGETCPHLGGPLSQGWLRDGSIVCPWHGSAFDLETGESQNGPAIAPAPRFQARVRDGRIEVRRVPPVVSAPPGSALTRQQEMPVQPPRPRQREMQP
ncbi:Rieske 2Fe-2S domain-containing protein [Sphaerimonospora thailandensis]|uniref:Rieske domain-containing protein n=1 Tax=Sphaerimonospora thailandensis TaxID=795644 RepID=A0A8J3RDH9_9ACTN|nr:Rieske 2Fe-2S domain-containing protein [Sphaerimonospora thailandensis]GIH72645.1 hypothetical protein Mth01_48980 [Sphaerimonospora thailandensis]